MIALTSSGRMRPCGDRDLGIPASRSMSQNRSAAASSLARAAAEVLRLPQRRSGGISVPRRPARCPTAATPCCALGKSHRGGATAVAASQRQDPRAPAPRSLPQHRSIPASHGGTAAAEVLPPSQRRSRRVPGFRPLARCTTAAAPLLRPWGEPPRRCCGSRSPAAAGSRGTGPPLAAAEPKRRRCGLGRSFRGGAAAPAAPQRQDPGIPAARPLPKHRSTHAAHLVGATAEALPPSQRRSGGIPGFRLPARCPSTEAPPLPPDWEPPRRCCGSRSAASAESQDSSLPLAVAASRRRRCVLGESRRGGAAALAAPQRRNPGIPRAPTAGAAGRFAQHFWKDLGRSTGQKMVTGPNSGGLAVVRSSFTGCVLERSCSERVSGGSGKALFSGPRVGNSGKIPRARIEFFPIYRWSLGPLGWRERLVFEHLGPPPSRTWGSGAQSVRS